MARKPLSYDEVIALAKEHYAKGGDGVYECWDRRVYDEYVSMFGPIYKSHLLKMFRDSYAHDREMAALAKEGW